MTPADHLWIRWPDGGGRRVAFGGDYNPEQWDAKVWPQDIDLMTAAGVNLVNVAIFGWAELEPEPGRYDFTLYDRVLDLLHEAGIAVDLATATASPPAWLVRSDPQMLPVNAAGQVLGFGSRQSWCPSSPVYRERSLALVHAVANHFADHPALALWHVSNELGCHNSRCYCEVSAQAFRGWLQRRYVHLDALNLAWGTAFWSQRYGSWDEVGPPRLTGAMPNPTHELDYARFSSDELMAQLDAEREVLAATTPDVPVTTNFMLMGETKNMDYAEWARHVDLVSNDHYLGEGDDEPEIELAFSADLTRGVAGGRPWMLMEQSTSAVNWGTVNRAKEPGEMRRNSLSHVARGADGISFFQWRASVAGSEKFHSAMLPHAGPESRVHREVVQLGAELGHLAEVVGSAVVSHVALLFDWHSWWASELRSHPSQQFRYREAALHVYEQLWRQGVTVDVVPVTADLSSYQLVVVPSLYLMADATVDQLDQVAARGGSVFVTYFSGIVDDHDHIRPGAYPGGLRDLLGLRVEEFRPLHPGQRVRLDDGSSGTAWSEEIVTTDASVVASFVDGSCAGQPAVTRRVLPGGGSAWYVGTRLGGPDLCALLARVCVASGVDVPGWPDRLEVVRRSQGDSGPDYLFAVNHGSSPAPLGEVGHDLLTGEDRGAGWAVPAGGAAVLRLDS